MTEKEEGKMAQEDLFEIKAETKPEKKKKRKRSNKQTPILRKKVAVLDPKERDYLMRLLRITEGKRGRYIAQRDAALLRLRNLEVNIDRLSSEIEEIEEKLGR
jgi:hypothetical protein